MVAGKYCDAQQVAVMLVVMLAIGGNGGFGRGALRCCSKAARGTIVGGNSDNKFKTLSVFKQVLAMK